MGRSPVHAFVALLLAVFAVVVVDGRNRVRLRRRRHEFGGVLGQLGGGGSSGGGGLKKHGLTEIIADDKAQTTPREKNRNKYSKDVTPCDIVHSECLDKALAEQELNKTKLKEQCAWALSDSNAALHRTQLEAINGLVEVSGRTRFAAVRDMLRHASYLLCAPSPNRAFCCPSRAQPPRRLPKNSWAVSPSSRCAFLFPGLFVPSVLIPPPSTRCPPAGSSELGARTRPRTPPAPAAPAAPAPPPLACHRMPQFPNFVPKHETPAPPRLTIDALSRTDGVKCAQSLSIWQYTVRQLFLDRLIRRRLVRFCIAWSRTLHTRSKTRLLTRVVAPPRRSLET